MKTVTTQGAISLIKAGLFIPGDLVGVNEHGHAIYAGPGRVPIVRVHGPRPDGVRVYRHATREVVK
jgi:hypothetical protein